MPDPARHDPGVRDDPAPGDNLLLVAARLWDGTGTGARRDVALVIRNGRVERVAGDRRVRWLDWSAPGRPRRHRDARAHGSSRPPRQRGRPRRAERDLGRGGCSTQLLTLHAAKNARLMLQAGFTTVRDLAGPINPLNLEVLALRRAIAIGLVPGPRIFVAGWVGQTGGHSDLPLPDAWPRDESVYADGPWAVRRLVRAEIRLGVDLFKTSASGGAAATRKNSGGGTTRPRSSRPSSTRRTRSASGSPSTATPRRPRSGRSGPASTRSSTAPSWTRNASPCSWRPARSWCRPSRSAPSGRGRGAPPAGRRPRSSGSTSASPPSGTSGSGGPPRPGCGWRSGRTRTDRCATTGGRTPTSSS